MRKLILVVVAAGLAGCVSVSGTMVKPGVYFVDASAHSSTVSRSELMEKFHAKARELCGPNDYDFETAVGQSTVDGGAGIPNVTGHVTCKGASVETDMDGTTRTEVVIEQE